MSVVKAYLEKIEQVITEGKFKDNWASLSEVGEPVWYKNAKFGIFIHWGVYAVPAFGSEWYPRWMYIEDSEIYKHHVETYGHPKDFPYENFVPMFKAEKFDASAWADLFKASGARYVMPVAEHHDGFQMYDSEISDWNAVKMGPKCDVVGELKREVEARDMVFTASSHRAENFFFMNGLRKFDSGLQDMDFQEPYGFALDLDPSSKTPPSGSKVYEDGAVPVAHLEDWLVRTCELVDKYQPKVVWFDWWIRNEAFKPYLQKFAAYYYNRGLEWGVGVAINYKEGAYPRDTAIFDVERGQLADIRPRFWQTDTAVAKNSWCYTENNDFKTPESIVADLIDVVSKNGCMLLNIGPKADGTITEEDEHVLRSIGQWLEANGEAIYDTTYWGVYGEGPTEIIEGHFNDVKKAAYTREDIRHTYKAPYVYASVLKYPEDGSVSIRTMAEESRYFKGAVKNIELLAYDNDVSYVHDEEALKIQVEGKIDTTYPVTFKILID